MERAEQAERASRRTLRCWMFSHLDQSNPPDDLPAALFDDPLLPMRYIAAELAGVK